MLEQFADLHFIRPWAFLLLIPMGLLIYFWHTKKHSISSWQNYCDQKFIRYLGVGQSEVKQRLDLRWVVSVVGFIAILALAGPVWQKLPQPVYKTANARVFVLDLSQSMLATDIAPNRLARAKHKLLDMLADSREGQSALVVFANAPYVVSPLTDDAHTIAAAVPALSTDLVPVQGSNVSLAVDKAISLLKQSNMSDGQIILIGDEVGDGVDDISSSVKEAGYRLSILAVGTREGSPIPDSTGQFLKDASGAIVIPKLDYRNMRTAAAQSNGKFAQIAIDDSDVSYLMSDSFLADRQFQTDEDKRQTDQWYEEGPWLLLMLLPLVALGFRRGWLVAVIPVFIGFPPQTSYAMDWDGLWQSKDQQAFNFMKKDEPLKAAESFEDKNWQGTAYYRAGDYEKAVSSLSNLDTVEANYNRANALAQLGKVEEAISSYDKVLKEDPDHKDAQYNRDLLSKFLEQQNQQQQKQQQQQQGQNENQSEQQSDQNQQGNKSDSENKEGQDSASQQAQRKNDTGQQDAQKQAAQDSQNAENSKQESGQKKTDEQQAQSKNLAKKEDDADKNKDKEGDEQALLANQEYKEDRQAMEQWLRRIPDDPGGLLRQKFLLQHRLQEAQENSKQPW